MIHWSGMILQDPKWNTILTYVDEDTTNTLKSLRWIFVAMTLMKVHYLLYTDLTLLEGYDDSDRLLSIREKNNNLAAMMHTVSRSPVSQFSFYDYLWDAITQFWDSLASSFSSAPLAVSASTQHSLAQLKIHVCAPFNKDDASHIEDLHRLWKIAFPDDAVPDPMPDDRWKCLGFQSDDPLRDFRGTGIFGLHNFLFMAEKYPETWSRILDLKEQRGERYPIAIAAFNVTMMLFELLGWGWKTPGQSTCKDKTVFRAFANLLFPSPRTRKEEAVNLFNEIYCISMLKLDETWDEIAKGYMDFPVVLTKTQEKVEMCIRNFKQIEDVFIWTKDNLY